MESKTAVGSEEIPNVKEISTPERCWGPRWVGGGGWYSRVKVREMIKRGGKHQPHLPPPPPKKKTPENFNEIIKKSLDYRLNSKNSDAEFLSLKTFL